MLFNPSLSSGPVGPLKSKLVVAVGNDDLSYPSGIIVQVATAGDITYRPLDSNEDLTETVARGDTIGVGGIPVLIKIIRGSSTITSVVLGFL